MKPQKNVQSGKKGFSLIEIIIVLIALGIIAAFTVPRFFTIADKTRARALSKAVGNLN